jgi:hypothetical protein
MSPSRQVRGGESDEERDLFILQDHQIDLRLRTMEKEDVKAVLQPWPLSGRAADHLVYYFEGMTMKEIGATLDLSESARQPDAFRRFLGANSKNWHAAGAAPAAAWITRWFLLLLLLLLLFFLLLFFQLSQSFLGGLVLLQPTACAASTSASRRSSICVSTSSRLMHDLQLLVLRVEVLSTQQFPNAKILLLESAS